MKPPRCSQQLERLPAARVLPALLPFFPTCGEDGLILGFPQRPDGVSDEVVRQYRAPLLWLICELQHTDS